MLCNLPVDKKMISFAWNNQVSHELKTSFLCVSYRVGSLLEETQEVFLSRRSKC